MANELKEAFLRSWFDVPESVHWAHGMSNEIEKEVSESFDRAIAAWNTRPAAPVEGLEVVAWKHPTSEWASNDYYQVECHCLKVGPMPIPLVARPQAEAIIAAKDVEIKQLKADLQTHIDGTKALIDEKINAEFKAIDLKKDNAALTARVKELEKLCNDTEAEALGYASDKAELEAKLAAANKALEFYRDGFKYHPKRTATGINISEWKPTNALLEDCGETARAALEAKP